MAEELIAGVCSSWWCTPISGSGFEGGGAMMPAVPASCSAHSNMNGAAFNWASVLDMLDFIEPRPYHDSSSPPVTISDGGPLAFQDIHEFSQVSAPLTETWSQALLSPALIQAQQASQIQSNHQLDGGLMDDSSLIDPMKGENKIQLYQESLSELNNCSTESSKSSANLTKEAPWSFNPPVPTDLFHHTNFDESSRCSNQAVKKANKGAEKRRESEPSLKKPRIETPSQLPTFKVRKEKLGDRITALQQLVSPFGKTDTASVLHEAIDYIKFLHDQVRVLSAPYLKKGHQQIKEQEEEDLGSRGLCLVPVSATFAVARENPMDFWTPFLGGTFR